MERHNPDCACSDLEFTAAEDCPWASGEPTPEDDSSPRGKTVDEMRLEVLDHVRQMVDYWATIKTADHDHSIHDRISGFAHSMLAMISGSAGFIPSFDVVPSPHESDEEYNRENGTNWWQREDINDGGLHRHLYQDEHGKAWNAKWQAAHKEEPGDWHVFCRQALKLGMQLVSTNGYNFWMVENYEIRTNHPDAKTFSPGIALLREINGGAHFLAIPKEVASV